MTDEAPWTKSLPATDIGDIRLFRAAAILPDAQALRDATDSVALSLNPSQSGRERCQDVVKCDLTGITFPGRNIVGFLLEMADPQELHDIPNWKAHLLTGDRKGTWSLTVTRNWRITFWIDKTEGEVVNLDYEDYH